MAGPGHELIARRELAEKCGGCGTCRSVCPMFAELGTESSVARGKVALIKATLDGRLELTDIFADRIELCLNCKMCVAECPNGVRVDDLILAARSGLVESGRFPSLKRLVLRLLLKRGRLLPPLGRFASFVQRVLLRELPPGSPLRILLPVIGIDRQRVLPQVAPRTFLHGMPEIVERAGAGGAPADQGGPARSGTRGSGDAPGSSEAAAGRGGSAFGGAVAAVSGEERRRIAQEAKRVAYFVGCATNLIYPEAGRGLVKAVSEAGVDVVIPHAQGCCGAPLFNAGDFATAREMAERNIEVLGATCADLVITGCASCGLALDREYRELLGFEGGVGLMVFDLCEFLVARGHAPARSTRGLGARVRVTYHDPCHLVRGRGISEEPRELLRSLPGVDFVEMRDADSCCGGGGTFCLSHYELSRAVGRKKIEAIREAGVDLVATECPVCVMHLRDMVARQGLKVGVVNVAELFT